MPTPTKGPRLGGGPAHERLLLANLATQLFEHRSITTTLTKARRVQPLAERMITFAKRGDLASRRRVLSVLRGGKHGEGIVHALFTEIAPTMAERQGGYTRITKVGNRKGDNAPLAVIELVLEPLTAGQATIREAEAATRRSASTGTAKKATASRATSARDAEAAAEAAATEAEDDGLAGDTRGSVAAAGEADRAAAEAETDAPGSSDAQDAAAAADLAEEAATKAVKKSGD